MANDKILIKDLHLRGVIGINDWERKIKQDIIVNIEMLCDLTQAGQSDDINQTVNYRSVAKKVIREVETAGKLTVEALAAEIARICLGEDRVEQVTVRVEKPGAVRFSKSVGVEITRDRHETF